MKRNDDLLRLAFGELSDDAARAVEATANDADRQKVEAYRSLREGLQHLPPPPPDNLSAERLRAAILDRDLVARRRPLAWLPNLLAPVALAAVAAVALLPRLRPRSEPQIVTAMGDARFAQPVERPRLDFPEFTAKRAAEPSNVVTAPIVEPQSPSMEPARERVRSHRRIHRKATPPVVAPPKEDAKDYVAMLAPNDELPVVGPIATPKVSPETIAAPPSAVVENAPGMPANAETVVIVTAKRDLETGAPAATEKEVSSVLVGG